MSVSTPRRPSCFVASLGLALASSGLFAACSDQERATASDSGEQRADSTASGWTGSSLSGEAPLSAGVLEVVDPQNPDRPFFHDFGTLDHGEELVWSKTLENVGPEPVTILTARGACACTILHSIVFAGPEGEEIESVSDFTRAEIGEVPAGGTATLHIKLLTIHSTANQNKLPLFRITTNSAQQPFSTFELRFFPVQSFIVAPSHLTLDQVPTSHGAEASVKLLAADPGAGAKVHRIVSSPEGLTTRLESTVFAGEEIWFLYGTVDPITPIGAIHGEVVLATSDPEGVGDENRISVPVFVRVVPDAVLEPGLISFAAVESGSEKTVDAQVVSLIPGSTLDVVETKIVGRTSDHFRVEAEPVRPNVDGRAKKWLVSTTLLASHPTDFIGGELVVTLREPLGGLGGAEGRELRTRIGGRVVESTR